MLDNILDSPKFVIERPGHCVITGFILELCFDNFHRFSMIETIDNNKINPAKVLIAGMMSADVKSSPNISEIKFFILIRFIRLLRCFRCVILQRRF